MFTQIRQRQLQHIQKLQINSFVIHHKQSFKIDINQSTCLNDENSSIIFKFTFKKQKKHIIKNRDTHNDEIDSQNLSTKQSDHV